MENCKVQKAEGKLGVLVVGLGAVGLVIVVETNDFTAVHIEGGIILVGAVFYIDCGICDAVFGVADDVGAVDDTAVQLHSSIGADLDDLAQGGVADACAFAKADRNDTGAFRIGVGQQETLAGGNGEYIASRAGTAGGEGSCNITAVQIQIQVGGAVGG